MESALAHHAKGRVISAFGNLLYVAFEGQIRQGELAFVEVGQDSLMAEVIEIAKDVAKIQVFEETSSIELFTPVRFAHHLLEAELGPGLLSSIFDGLQNPLEEVGEKVGIYLKRGVYLPSLDRNALWEFTPVAKKGDLLKRGDTLGSVKEGRFVHKIMVPFSFYGTFKVEEIASKGSYKIEEVIAKGFDEKGKPRSFTMLQKWPIKNPLVQGERLKLKEMMDTGMRIIDTGFPLLKGGTFCSPGPFGAGKTVLQHHLAKYSSVDVVVIAACGERAGEVVELLRTFPHLTDVRTGEPLLKRTVVICNTSSMPVAAREASVYMGVTIAEYYRQMGLDVLLLADSTSRWAQAMREMSGRLEEIPGEEAFPAYLASRISAFYERAGRLSLPDGEVGSLTIGGSVSPAGGNFEEPVTQATLSVVGAFLALSRARSDARRYPAIDPLLSWTKYHSGVALEISDTLPNWGDWLALTSKILNEGDEIGKRMEVVGQEGISIQDMVIFLKSELYDICYLQQNAFDKEDSYCPLERQFEIFSLIILIFKKEFGFASQDDARSFFLVLQNDVKNLNYLPFRSAAYLDLKEEIEKSLEI